MSNQAPSRSVILGCAGAKLTTDEQAFFREADPFGFILFARNVENPDQLCQLTSDLCESVDRPDAPVFIDQEGGRVQRMRPPHWRVAPAMQVFGELYKSSPEKAREALALNIALLAAELRAVGISVDCAPLLDVSNPATHAAIGDRAFSPDADSVCDLGRVAMDAFMANGVFPVIKHIPGHGRATVDSHKDLPVVSATHDELSAIDFKPFQSLRDAPFGMTAHIIYEAIDAARPATTSPTVIHDVIRQEIGFEGLLISDDLSMHALTGDFESRARGCLEAGCDLALHCNGDPAEMEAVGRAAPPMTESQWSKWRSFREDLKRPADFDTADAERRLESLLAGLL